MGRQDFRELKLGCRGVCQPLWKSFQASWKAMNVLPVPVAIVSRMRFSPDAMV
jgi:hypothetical protein